MSLLDTASLLLTPNAYKEGKLYSVIPSDGSGDFTFTRATTATRVNSDGLVELVPYNLLTYSEQFDNAAWTKVNSTITANAETAPNGTLTADTFTDNSTSGSHVIARFTTLIIGTQTASIYVKPNTLNKFYIGNSSTGNAVCFDLTTQTIEGYTNGTGNAWTNASIEDVGNGWFRVSASLVATASGTFSIGFYKVFNATSFGAMSIYVGTGESAYLWGAQLVEGTNALPYQRTETRLNIPRIDSSLGGCPSILLEPQRTNLTLYSSYFDNAYWFKENSTISANSTISPSGVQDADALTDNTTNSRHRIYNVFSGTIGTNYTLSIYVKKNSPNRFLLLNAAAVIGQRSVLNLDTLAITNLNGTSGQVVDAGNGWYRFSISGTALVASGVIYYQMQNSNADVSYIGDGSSFYLWGAQLEAGAYATSYIQTTTASVTRNAEVYNRTGVSSLIGQTEGTMFVDFFAKTPSELRRMSISDGTLNNRIVIVHRTTGEIQFIVVNGGVTQADFVTSAIYQSNQEVKVAFAYKANDFIAYINGVQAFTDTSGTVPTTSRFGFTDGDGTSFPFNNSVKLAGLWKERLTNDQLAQLTTI